MKLLYLIAGTYRAAGMEKVLTDKTNWLVRHGYDVTIATTDQRGQAPAFPINPSIRMVDLGIDYEATNGSHFLKKAALFPLKQLRHRRRLKALLMQEKPDITISMFCNDVGFLPKIQDGAKKTSSTPRLSTASSSSPKRTRDTGGICPTWWSFPTA